MKPTTILVAQQKEKVPDRLLLLLRKRKREIKKGYCSVLGKG